MSVIDLSRLPAPSVVEALDFEAIYAELKADLVLRAPQLAPALELESEALSQLLQVVAYRELILRNRVNQAARSVMVAYAMDADLEHLAAVFGVQRLAGESDSALRGRLLLAPDGYSTAGPAGAYVFHALSADPDVADVGVASPAPGEVVVTVLSHSGNGVPGAPLLATVLAALSADTVRPLTDHVTVWPASLVNYAVEAVIHTYGGPDPATVIAAANSGLAAYLADQHRLGRDVTRSGLFAALHVAGVQRVDLVSPAADVVVGSTQVANATALSISHGGLGD